MYDREVAEFRAAGEDLGSEEFLGSSYAFVRFQAEAGEEIRAQIQAIVDAAFATPFRARTEEAVRIFFDDRSGGTPESNLLVAVDDFLNYVLPRSIGLPDANDRFNQLYEHFERDLLTNVFSLSITALIEGVRDHGASFRRAGNVGFTWASRPRRGAAANGYVRNSAVTYLDLKQGANPIGGGRSLPDVASFFLLDVQESLPKRENIVSFASARTEEMTRRVVFLLRLLTRSPVFSDYRGFRILGHRSGHYMTFMNWPDEYIPGTESRDLMTHELWFRILVPYIVAAPWTELEVVHRKFEDAFRRQRTAVIDRDRAERMATIDRLLDYCQALEALLPLRTKYRIAISASALLAAHFDDNGQRATEIFETVSNQYNLRNDVMHGRIDEVLSGRGRPLDVSSLELVVRDLTILRILNPGVVLEDLADRLLLKQPVQIRRMSGLLEEERVRLQQNQP